MSILIDISAIHAGHVKIEEDTLFVDLSDGRTIAVPWRCILAFYMLLRARETIDD